MTAPLLVIAAGGTGGHMFPAQALAEEMLARGWAVQLSTDARGLRYAGGFPEAVARVEVAAATVTQGGLTARLAAPVTILRGVLQAIWRFRRERPAAVIGFGGYPAIPALTAAWLLGLPRLIHEQNGVLGRVNRLFARRVGKVACGTWPLTNPPAGADLVAVGNPIRQAARDAMAMPYAPPAPDGPLRLLVFGGSQGASVFAKAVPGALAHLPESQRARLEVVQQVRPGEEQEVAEAYAALKVRVEAAPFFDDMPARISAATLVIARAGASTVAEIAAIGRPSVLVPYPHAMDDHQTANAIALATEGAAVLMPERELTPEALAVSIGRLLAQPEAAARMASAARALGRPEAARDLADLVEETARAR